MKNIFIKSTLILLIGSMFTKFIGFFIKIYYTRLIGSEAIALLSQVLPTYSLLLSIANFNIQTAISKRISSGNGSKSSLINSFYIMIIINFILVSLTFIFGKFISSSLLKNKYLYLPLVASSLSLPFVSLGYIIKGYYYGIQNVLPHMISNVLEQLFRLLIIILILPKVIKYGSVITISVLLLFNVFSELFSIIILFIFLPKKIKINKNNLKIDYKEINFLLNICGPTVLGRIICNIAYFFEPILFNFLLLYKGFNINDITLQYGIYHMYSISLLLFPSFFITSISNSLLPEINKFYYLKKYNLVKRRFGQAILISFAIGLVSSLFIYINASFLLSKLYNTSLGLNYIKILCPFFILFYLEGPISSTLIGIDKIKESTLVSIIGSFLKLFILVISIITGFNYYSLIISEIFDILFVVITEIFILHKSFIFNNI